MSPLRPGGWSAAWVAPGSMPQTARRGWRGFVSQLPSPPTSPANLHDLNYILTIRLRSPARPTAMVIVHGMKLRTSFPRNVARRKGRLNDELARPSIAPSSFLPLVPAASEKTAKSALTIAEPKRLRDKAHLKFVATQPVDLRPSAFRRASPSLCTTKSHWSESQ